MLLAITALSMIPKSVQRFFPCAKPSLNSGQWTDASAGAGRSEKIMRDQQCRATS
jgi:hypothetical protein